jgi:hypothetical protein
VNKLELLLDIFNDGGKDPIREEAGFVDGSKNERLKWHPDLVSLLHQNLPLKKAGGGGRWGSPGHLINRPILRLS